MWQTLVLQPMYNTLIALSSLAGGSLGWAVIGVTFVIKLILLPFALKTHTTQILQKKLQPKIAEIKKEFPDKQEQSLKIMELYKESGSNPFSGCLPILIQLPILIGLYRVFYVGIEEGSKWLYSTVSIPGNISTMFMGVDLATKSIPLALFAGAFQALQLYLSPTMKNLDPNDPQAKISRMMMFMVPVMIVVAGSTLPASLSLYFVATSIFTIIQEFVFTRLQKTT